MAETAIFMANGVEECEALIVVDLLRRADIEIQMISIENTKEVEGSHGIRIICDAQLDDYKINKEKMLIIPGGGKGVERLTNKERLSQILKDFAQAKGEFAAICAGPSVLGKLNILEGKQVTSYPSWQEKLGEGIDYKNEKVVADERVITGQALGSAIPFALKLIERLRSKEAADRVEQQIYY